MDKWTILGPGPWAPSPYWEARPPNPPLREASPPQTSANFVGLLPPAPYTGVGRSTPPDPPEIYEGAPSAPSNGHSLQKCLVPSGQISCALALIYWEH